MFQAVLSPVGTGPPPYTPPELGPPPPQLEITQPTPSDEGCPSPRGKSPGELPPHLAFSFKSCYLLCLRIGLRCCLDTLKSKATDFSFVLLHMGSRCASSMVFSDE